MRGAKKSCTHEYILRRHTVVVVLVLVLLTPTSLLDLKEGLFSLPLILNY